MPREVRFRLHAVPVVAGPVRRSELSIAVGSEEDQKLQNREVPFIDRTRVDTFFSLFSYYCLAVQNTLLRDEYKDKFSVDESSIVQDPSCFFLSSDIPPVKTIGEFLREIKTDDFLLDDDVLRKNSMVRTCVSNITRVCMEPVTGL